jgi:hypothetical protein
LFRRPQRAFSHGCVRVEQARQLAAWALDVPVGEIDRMIARGATVSVPMPEEIPVYLGYHTRFPDDQGQIATYPDIYADWEEAERAYLARATARRQAVAKRPVSPPAAAPPPSAPPDSVAPNQPAPEAPTPPAGLPDGPPAAPPAAAEPPKAAGG